MGPKAKPKKRPISTDLRSISPDLSSGNRTGQKSGGGNGPNESPRTKSLATANSKEEIDPDATDRARGRMSQESHL